MDADRFLDLTTVQGLVINPEKCQVIEFPAKEFEHMPVPRILLQSSPLYPSSNIKVLGVWFSSDLKWNIHLDFVFKKSARASYLIKLLHNRGVKGAFLKSLCESLVFSHLTYCWPILCDSTDRDLLRFVSLEKRMTKLCRTPTTSQGLRTRLDNQCVSLANKIRIHEGHPLEACFQRNPSTCPLRLRKTKKFLPLSARKARLRNSFTKFAC